MDKLSERKQKILKAVVDEYIFRASPVSSGEIKSKYFEEISSATIRNELSALEEMGYLIQPHTSAGRIPSKKAYSLYVDKFLRKQPLSQKEIALIEESFQDKFSEIEEIVRRTAKVISDVTNYTSVIVLNNINKVVLKEIKLVDLDESTLLVIIITDSGIIRDKVITLQSGVTQTYIKDANTLLNRIFSGRTVQEIKAPDTLIEEELREFKDLYESILAIIVSYSGSKDSDVILEGESKFLDCPDHDINSAREFLSVMDTKEQLTDLLEESQDIEFSVRIGKDERGGIDKCAIVTAKYRLNGKEIGKAGVIGPERMDYSKVMSVLSYIGKTLDIMTEGGRNGREREIDGKRDGNGDGGDC